MSLLRKITANPLLVLLSLFSAFLLYVDCSAHGKTPAPEVFRSSVLLSGEYGRNGQADLLESSSSGNHSAFSSSGRRQDLSRKNRMRELFHSPLPSRDISFSTVKKKNIFICRKISFVRQLFHRSTPVRAGPFSV